MSPQVSPKTQAVRAVKRSWYELRNSVQDIGLLPTHTGYTRFLILASARTGSTLLTRSLNRHSGALAYGEILRDRTLFPARFPEFGYSQSLYENDPVAFLESKVYRKYPAEIKAVGFKIFYRHAPQDTTWGKAVWEYLSDQKAIRVIHLRRRNLLKVQVSRQKAAETKEWIKYSAERQDDAITLNYEETLARFIQVRQWETECAALFAGHPLLNMYYEDVVADYGGEIARMQSFLGIATETVPPPTKQRPSRPLSSQIANYHELKAQFQGSPWAEFFEE